MLRTGTSVPRVSLLAAIGLAFLPSPAAGQVGDHAIHGRHGFARHGSDQGNDAELAHTDLSSAATAPTVLTGRVLGPDGAPEVGAVVVSSAGGQSVTAADGTFQIEVHVPLDADSVQVTAVAGAGAGAGSLVASTCVASLTHWGTTPVGRLVLVQTTSCQPSWLPTFGGQPGVSMQVSALTVFDDGSGPALYAGGGLSSAGGVAANRIAKWNGTSWSQLGSGMNNVVYALTVFDDGGGPALYAGGQFTIAGGVAANKIAKWNGTSWSALGSGMDGTVYALTVFSDGSGPALYAGGRFTLAGGVAANRIAKWNGTSWSQLGSGMNRLVSALTVFDDGSGPALYAGGQFTTTGGVAANSIAKWNGTSWSALGSGMNRDVYALTVFDDGSSPALYAGGLFTSAGGVAANKIAKWNGTSWSALGAGVGGFLGNAVQALTVFDDGSGTALYAGGSFFTAGGVAANLIAKWNGTSWSQLGSGIDGYIGYALTVFDDGSGPALYAGGLFFTAGGVAAKDIAKWNGTSWSALGNGMNYGVLALTVFDDGSGPALYAGGGFTTAGGVAVIGLAKWNGTNWSQLGSGLSNGGVSALTVFDDGSGPALYAGGAFTSASGVVANSIAKWNGTSWSALGSGMAYPPGAYVSALTAFDDGSGPALYAGGDFTTAGGAAANSIAKWNGTSWSALGSGMNFSVYALTVFDDSSGPALYAGGVFTSAGGVAANRIAKWNGTSWSTLGSGMSGSVYDLTVFDDGSGPALYAGGGFTSASGVVANSIAKWNGTSWSTLGSGMTYLFGSAYVYALTAFDDGSGPALYAGGDFTTAGGVAANRIAKWNGTSWSALGAGVSSGSDDSEVQALTVFDDGSGMALHAGGSFTISPVGDSYLAKWGCPAITSLPGCAGNPATLAALVPSAPLGAALPLRITGSAALSGLGLVYFGAPGFDGSGCGLVMPGLGEVLLALAPPAALVASGLLAGGTCNVSLLVPNDPALAGATVHLQGAAVDLALPQPIELSNALAVKLGP